MYKEIDELIENIIVDEVFLNYCQTERELYDETTLALVSRHQILQEDYLRIKAYSSEDELKEMREKLKELNSEISQNQKITDYYQAYHHLNDLLEEITQMVFANISDELVLDRFTL
ncbi:YlbF family regulator [Candidatus Stoquefichus massiliensis]|uniref:YlbF family regulator n=1 Tax=Candidatus Stoquefichus massiliensis TaxID=1470350 RepID=UPI000483B422|nr:YlbF family regulator [Candidatus Stoquefichus massiliensis]